MTWLRQVPLADLSLMHTAVRMWLSAEQRPRRDRERTQRLADAMWDEIDQRPGDKEWAAHLDWLAAGR